MIVVGVNGKDLKPLLLGKPRGRNPPKTVRQEGHGSYRHLQGSQKYKRYPVAAIRCSGLNPPKSNQGRLAPHLPA